MFVVLKSPSFCSSDVLSQISYVTIGKDAYLLEVPESLSGSIPRDYELQSSKKVTVGVVSEVDLYLVSPL